MDESQDITAQTCNKQELVSELHEGGMTELYNHLQNYVDPVNRC